MFDILSLQALICPGLYVLGKSSALGAIYNSLEQQQLDAPKCHSNTRKAVIKKIITWICGIIDSEALIMWLYTVDVK